MDAVLRAIAQSAPQLGISGVLITVIVLLIRREASAEKRHTAELQRITKSHDQEIEQLRERQDELQAELDKERTRRRQAEDGMPQRRRPRRDPGP